MKDVISCEKLRGGAKLPHTDSLLRSPVIVHISSQKVPQTEADALSPVPCKAVQKIPDGVVLILIRHNPDGGFNLFLTGKPVGFLQIEKQILGLRCQLAKMGCPIKGDLKYGFARSNPDGSICLHARHISFVHPVSKEMIEVEAPVPPTNLWQGFKMI